MTDRTEVRMVATIADAARKAGLSRGTLASWVAVGLVHRGPGGIDLSEVLRIKLEREQARQRRPGSASEHWLAEVRRHRAETIALLNARTLGRLVPHTWVLEQHAARVALIERDLGHLAKRLVPELERMGIAESRAGRIREELANLVRAYARNLPAPPPPPGPEVEDLHDDDDPRDSEGTTDNNMETDR